MKLMRIKLMLLAVLFSSNCFAATNTLHDKSEKVSPTVNDETYVWDITDSTLKKAKLGNLPTVATDTSPCVNDGDMRVWNGTSWVCTSAIDITVDPPLAYNSTTNHLSWLSAGLSSGQTWVWNGSAFAATSVGGSMTWPSSAGIAVYGGSSAWGTSLPAPSGTIVGTTDEQSLSNKEVVGATYPSSSSSSTGTGDINIDGVSADHYYFNNGASTATYTPVIASPPASGKERGIVLTVGGGAGVITMTWTNVSFMGTAGATTTTASKYNHYACIIPSSGNAKCKIIAEASDY